MKAIWQNTILAESDHTIVIEGNHYFPPASLKCDYLAASDNHTTCHWKGVASYYHVKVGDKMNPDAAWYYPEPKDAVKSIKNFVAFRRGVNIAE
jgi:uncharacterized protein (DUF427 family)